MVSTGSLVLYKARLALVTAVEESRATILIEGAESKKVRDKDIVTLHRGPCKTLPFPRTGGDFETARSMIVSGKADDEPVKTSWRELAELVFGDGSPESMAACVRAVLDTDLFRLVDDIPAALTDGILKRLRDRELEKQKEIRLKNDFIAAFSGCVRDKVVFADMSKPEFSRFITELENYARGSGERNAFIVECGLAESREIVHQALVNTGIWKPGENPWPARAGCVLHPSRYAIDSEIFKADTISRRDLKYLRAYAIDNEWSTDPDDAISLEGETIWVHIADPAAFIGPDSEIDREALRRGATLYLPEMIIPMLPPEIMDRLGLGLNAESQALSVKITLDESGGIISAEILPTLLKVTRLSYSKADVLLASGDPDLRGLNLIADRRRKKRMVNGAVEITFPEVSMKTDGEDVRFIPVPETKSSSIVQEMMLLAGEAAARWAWERKLPFTYSSQEAPQFPQDLPRFDACESRLSQQYLRRKGMRASIVGTERQAHQGLGLSFYAQITSPLRRYQDLLAHYQLRAALAADSGARALPEDEVGRRCLLASQAALATRQAERDSRLHWIAFHLSRHRDWTGNATVMDSNERECTVFIHDFGLETVIRTRIQPSVDSRIKVKLTRVAVAMRDFNFEFAD